MRETAQYYLDSIRSKLDLPSTTRREVLRELASHYADLEDELAEAGLQPSEIDMAVTKRMGDPADIAARLNTAHNTASWKSALMCALPFVGSAALLSIGGLRARTALTIILLAMFSAASIWEFIKNRRPVWLAPWLAGAFGCAVQLVEIATNSRFDAFFGDLDSRPVVAILAARVVAGFLLAMLTVLIVRHIRPWRNAVLVSAAVIGIGGTYLVVAREGGNILVLFPVILAALAVITYFARGVFEMHRYGSPTLASLFLLTWFTRRYGSAGAGPEFLPLIISSILCGAAVVWLARTPSRDRKTTAIWLAIFLWAMGNVLHQPETWSHRPILLIVDALVEMVPVYPLVFFPLWNENRARKDTPAVSR